MGAGAQHKSPSTVYDSKLLSVAFLTHDPPTWEESVTMQNQQIRVLWPETGARRPFRQITSATTSRKRVPVTRRAHERQAEPFATVAPPRETTRPIRTLATAPAGFTAREPGKDPSRTQAMRDRFGKDPKLPRDERFGPVEWR
jgi:hypothetical protein